MEAASHEEKTQKNSNHMINMIKKPGMAHNMSSCFTGILHMSVPKIFKSRGTEIRFYGSTEIRFFGSSNVPYAAKACSGIRREWKHLSRGIRVPSLTAPWGCYEPRFPCCFPSSFASMPFPSALIVSVWSRSARGVQTGFRMLKVRAQPFSTAFMAQSQYKGFRFHLARILLYPRGKGNFVLWRWDRYTRIRTIMRLYVLHSVYPAFRIRHFPFSMEEVGFRW